MHELALTEGILRILEAEAQRQAFSRVRRVWLELGGLSHAEPDAIRFCFDWVMKGTLAEGARLDILRTPGKGWCMPCAAEIALHHRFDPCPLCGGHQVQVIDGDAMQIKELEVT